jgi:hypothetical protein
MANVPGLVVDAIVKITDPVSVTFVQAQMAKDGISSPTEWLTRFVHERATDLAGPSAASQITAAAARKTAPGFHML